ncbi:copper resistance CopC/CopD family protein [Amycolatopsis anabasis]|uniref:copper resistance CopC/CopD family protein n=1 Tax=Amycolatopsis anabasis TaxID=1840409 RepID=UPI00131DF998|nr:copper resistance protein CopC [Amycolatopsis anabasis]
MLIRLPRPGRVLVVAALACGVLVWQAPRAAAHAELVETAPANGAQLATSPREVVLRFSETVSPVRDGFRVLDERGAALLQSTAEGVPGDRTRVRVPLPESLGDGVYAVTWRVVSADSHPIHGAFVFSVGAARAAPLADSGARAGADAAVGFAFWLSRITGFAGLAMVVGGVGFVLVCWPAGRADRRLRLLIRTGWIASVASALAAFLLQGPNMAGSSLADAVDPALLYDTLGTGYGLGVLARILLLGLAGVALARSRTEVADPLPRKEIVLAAGLAVALAVSWSATGHAAAGAAVAGAIALDSAHLLAMSVWLGGLACLVTCVLRGRGIPHRTAIRVVPRFSRVAAVAVAVLAATGFAQAWRELAAAGGLSGNRYFSVLVFKVGAFGLLLCLAALSRSVVRNRLAGGKTGGATPRSLRRSVRWEALIGVVVLGLTAVLVATPPGGHDHGPSAAALPAGPFLGAPSLGGNGDVQVWVAPARVGPNQIVLNVRDARGINRDVPEVTARLHLPSAGIGPLPVPLTRTGPGQFVAGAVTVPVAGTWRLEIGVRATEFDQTIVDSQVPVR